MNNHRFFIIISLLTLFGAFFRFYNLNWGSPFYFHPDERNIASVITTYSSTDPSSFLKGTFAYGTFLALTAFFVQQLISPIFQAINIIDPFSQAIIILRMQSVIFSLLLLLFIWYCKKFFSKQVIFITLLFAIFSAGLIQQAHFGTFDCFVTLCSFAVFFFSLSFLKTKKFRFYYASLLFVSLGTAAKINLIILAIFPLVILVAQKPYHKNLLIKIKHLLLGLILLGTPLIFSPYYTTSDFQRGLLYERSLVTGELPVFYAQSFIGTYPIIFQFTNIYPFLIGPLLTILFIPSFIYLIFQGIKTKNQSYLILSAFFAVLFLPQSFLFAKWTRYIIPTIPFIYLTIAIALTEGLSFIKKHMRYVLFAIIIGIQIIFGISYFITAFVQPDTRVAAATFARNNIPANARILSETFDLGITPFQGSQIKLFNFYDLDINSPDYNSQTLKAELSNTDYIILPSQRVLQTRLGNKNKFLVGNDFYKSLVNGDLGFKKIYETPCDIFCKIIYLGDPVFRFEQTASVFEKPTVFIFKKLHN